MALDPGVLGDYPLQDSLYYVQVVLRVLEVPMDFVCLEYLKPLAAPVPSTESLLLLLFLWLDI